MSIFSIVDKSDIEKVDLTLSSNLVGNNAGKVGHGIAYHQEELEALMESALSGQKHAIDDAKEIFDAKMGIMLVVTPAYRNNYSYDCTAVLSAGDAGPDAAGDEPSCVEYLIRLKSIEQAGEDDDEAADYTDQPMQAAILLGVPQYATSVRVWVLAPDADDDEAELLDPYQATGATAPKTRPAETPAQSQAAIDLASIPRPGRVN